eukprot:4660259-Amphidinium_carterae.1
MTWRQELPCSRTGGTRREQNKNQQDLRDSRRRSRRPTKYGQRGKAAEYKAERERASEFSRAGGVDSKRKGQRKRKQRNSTW